MHALGGADWTPRSVQERLALPSKPRMADWPQCSCHRRMHSRCQDFERTGDAKWGRGRHLVVFVHEKQQVVTIRGAVTGAEEELRHRMQWRGVSASPKAFTQCRDEDKSKVK